MKKKPKVINYATIYKESLALLAARPEFKAFMKLLDVEEKNIVIQSFKVNSADPEIARKKAHFEGRIYEVRKIKVTFEEAKKGTE